ncbi:MAG: hypothetical protein QM811_10530 [Pirellulales bacterium]
MQSRARAARFVGTSLIFARLVNACWSCFKAAIFVALAAGIGAGIYYAKNLNGELRLKVLEKLASQHPHLHIELQSASLLDGEGILLRGLTIEDPAAPEPARVLATCDELLLSCNVDLTELARGEPDVKHVSLRRLKVYARFDSLVR